MYDKNKIKWVTVSYITKYINEDFIPMPIWTQLELNKIKAWKLSINPKKPMSFFA